MEQHLVILLVKLAVAASLASILARSGAFQRTLMREERTLVQRVQLALSMATIFGLGVATRVKTGVYQAVDLGLEGSFVAGILGGYVCGLLGGILISVPAMINGEYLTMALFAGVGTLGALLRDLAPNLEDIWRFSPFFDLNIYRLFRKWSDHKRTIFHLALLCTILFAEFLRYSLRQAFGSDLIFSLHPSGPDPHRFSILAVYATTLFATTLPLKIWNNTRNERKLEAQGRLLTEARLEALSSQINPHFLFNTLNTIASLIRLNPEQARAVLQKLSNILRRLLRKHDNLNPLRDELAFIDDYLSIEMVRFGDKLKFVKDVDPATLDRLVPAMLLQPLVENSLRHGLSPKVNGGMIRVRSRLVDDRLHLLVEDDGLGIPEAKLATLFERGIGVSNVNERLKVLFGNNYRMSIDSRPGEGTRTEIDIPATQTRLAAVS
ncbi:MAG: sensor histidine kinase [Bryobacteraceae bacterium]